MKTPESLLQAFQDRQANTLDEARKTAQEKRHAKGYLSARENLANLCDPGSFDEYGQFAVAAQRQRIDYETLKTSTAADGIITGTADVNGALPGLENTRSALVVNDYSVIAGTQGYFHHQKLDRILETAATQKLPVIMYAEGGGGRPGDTDISTVNSGLQCQSFSRWAALQGVVPRIAVANGYCFAGNAALFGAADITIATRKSWIGMAGPAMIEGGGLGSFSPTDIGPIEVQSANGVVDIVADDEHHAAALAKQCLSMFQGSLQRWSARSQEQISAILPEDRRFVYDMRVLIQVLADRDSFIELRRNYGGAIITGLIRLQGRTVGLLASDCAVLGGAIDADAADKAADFLELCERFSFPVLSLCDTPGFMVGPEHEKQGAARRLTRMFTAGAKLRAPLVALVVRKCYGLGAQAMLGGSTMRPQYTLSWPSGEFGAMGLEGAVKLGFKKELAALQSDEEREALFGELLARQYERGQAEEVAAVLEIDAVIHPVESREVLCRALFS